MSLIKRIFGRSDELKQAIIIRTDLDMGKGKIAAQASHAALTAADKSPYKKKWVDQGQKKVVLKVTGELELFRLNQDAKDLGLTTALITDAGHTQIKPGSKTALAIGPAPEKELDRVCGELKLL